MERQGLSPLPVYHLREPEKYLYMAMDYPYFAVGGIATGAGLKLEQHLDGVFSKVCTKESDFYPTHKVHGFGIAVPELLALFPWHSADSVTEDSVLLLRDCGKIRIESIGSLYNSCSNPIKTLASGHHYKELYNTETYTVDKSGVGKWCTTTKVFKHEVRKNIFDIKTSYGHSVSVTGDHSCFVIREEEKICIPTKEITTFDKFIKVNYQDSFSDLKELTIFINVPSFKKTDGLRNNTCFVKRPRRIVFTKELLEFFGLWLADGAFSKSGLDGKRRVVGISAANDIECRELLIKIASMFDRELILSNNGVDSSIRSVELLNIMTELGFITGSYNKEIPWWVFELSRENLCSLLRGYFSGDGCISTNIEYASVSNKLLYGIYYLLCKLGINVSLNVGIIDKIPTGSIIELEGKLLFLKEIKFLQEYKNEKLREETEGKIPRGTRSKVNNQEMYLSHRGIIKNPARKIIVFDLEVPGEESFLANGLLMHNTTSWVAYGKFGIILVPRQVNGRFRYDVPPQTITISTRSKSIGKPDHFFNLPPMEQEKLERYFHSKGLTVGESETRNERFGYRLKKDEVWVDKGYRIVEKVIERGLCNDGTCRDRLNLIYFLDLEQSQPEWPWQWHPKKRDTLFS